ncbi:hypothetical protein TNCV_3062331 [Trichonephila clavipes]|nr:hypothetical protein TNCV_3062331 [Trichonephila clavipes]
MAKLSSCGHRLSNDTFLDPMRPLAPEEIEVKNRGDKHADKQAFTVFNRFDNILSLINDELVILPQTACLKLLVFSVMMEGD